MTRVDDWKSVFIKALADERSVTHACRVARISRTTAYEHRATDPEFGRQWSEAWEEVLDELEGSAMRRAIDGWEAPVWHQGVQCGTETKIDNRLTEFMLRKNRPTRYGEQLITDDVQTIAAKVRAAIQEARRLDTAEGHAEE